MVVYTNTSYTDKKRLRKKKWKLRFLFLLFLLAGGGAVYLVFFTSFFRFAEVRIVGNPALQAEDIMGSRTNPFFWDEIRIAHAGLGGVKVHKDLLRRVLTIEIEERAKYGVWCGKGSPAEGGATSSDSGASYCYWFDANGILFREAPSVEGMLIPKIKDLSGRMLKAGDPLIEERFLGNVLAIFEIFKKMDISLVSLRLEDVAKQEVVAELISGPKVYFSTRFDPSFARVALESLKSRLHTLSYIDFRAENKVYYK